MRKIVIGHRIVLLCDKSDKAFPCTLRIKIISVTICFYDLCCEVDYFLYFIAQHREAWVL